MTLKALALEMIESLRGAGIESPRSEVYLLISKIFGLRPEQIIQEDQKALSAEQTERLKGLISRRLSGEPMAYILEERGFYKHDFIVRPGVLIPRPETEQLVELAIQFAEPGGLKNSNPQIVDLGCGSGCLGLSVLSELPNSFLTAVDNSKPAIEVTGLNAKKLGLQDRVCIEELDLCKPIEKSSFASKQKSMDILLGNPPYIDVADQSVEKGVRRFEPSEALFADEEGFLKVRVWCEWARFLLKPSGFLALEIGYDQGQKALEELVQLQAFDNILIHKDLSGLDRVVTAIRRL